MELRLIGAATHFGRLCDHILTGQRSDSGHDVMVAPNRDDGISGPRSIILSMTLSHHPLTMMAAMFWCET